MQVRDAIKAAALANGFTFLDLIEMNQTRESTTIATASTGSNIYTNAPLTRGSFIRVGNPTDTYVWTTRVASVSGSSAPYTIGVSPNLQGTTVVGAPVQVVGQAFITGTGKQGAVVGDGNSDYMVGNDNTHPTIAGHDNLARAMFRQLTATLPA